MSCEMTWPEMRPQEDSGFACSQAVFPAMFDGKNEEAAQYVMEATTESSKC